MQKYAFILGRNWLLSKDEVKSVLEKLNIGYKILEESDEAVIIESTKIRPDLLTNLGGTIKIAQITAKKKYPKDFRKLVEKDDIASFFTREGKTKFSISTYNLHSDKGLLKRINGSLKAQMINLKKDLKKDSIKASFVPSQGALSAVSVQKNGLLEDGNAEIVILVGEESFYLAKTLSVFDFEEYSFRDYGRPKRDTLSGTTPPKLAKIMINLAQKDNNSSFLDPFCGSGTFIQEMVLLGYKKVYGSDNSEKAIADTARNIEWLKNQYHHLKDYEIDIFKADSKELTAYLDKGSIDAIVTETYLGPPQKSKLSKRGAKETAQKLETLYRKSFEQFASILKKKGVIVIALPAFKTQEEIELVDIAWAKPLGFRLKEVREKSNLSTKRGGYLYFREDQKVYREILVFEKEK